MTTEVIEPPAALVVGDPGAGLRPASRLEAPADDYFGYDILLRPSDRSAFYERSKRVVDVIVACILLILLSPLILVVSLWIKFTDFGPVFFCQKRVGRNGRLFNFYKFRSMIPNADDKKHEFAHLSHHGDERTFKIPDDPRITRVGRWIRRFSIDEVPQLWNVVRGDMSLVGPRPPVPREVELYSRFDRRRFEVRPGLTCFWQVCGRGNIAFDRQVLMDVEYIDERSLWLDFKLMLLPIPAVFLGRGAY